MRSMGIFDAFASVKQRENEVALRLLPDLLRAIDAVPPGMDRGVRLLRGVLAGNIFDLGAAASAAAFGDLEGTAGERGQG